MREVSTIRGTVIGYLPTARQAEIACWGEARPVLVYKISDEDMVTIRAAFHVGREVDATLSMIRDESDRLLGTAREPIVMVLDVRADIAWGQWARQFTPERWEELERLYGSWRGEVEDG